MSYTYTNRRRTARGWRKELADARRADMLMTDIEARAAEGMVMGRVDEADYRAYRDAADADYLTPQQRWEYWTNILNSLQEREAVA